MAGTPVAHLITITASAVQAWADGATNRGMCIVIKAGETVSKTFKSTEDTSDPLRPWYLIIEYTPPVSVPTDTRLTMLGVGS